MKELSMTRFPLTWLTVTLLLAVSCGFFASCAGKPADPALLVRYHVQAVKSLAEASDQEPLAKREKILAYWSGAKAELERAVIQLQAEALKAGNGTEADQFDVQIESIFNDLRDLGLILKEQGIQLDQPAAG
ncbi:MAG: hypothetical protein EHM28_02735 [Spirochaetaceae bacterium]|nr:MAG: hypothetical protein EHM28_02735 [Spirochaetaceae bacterium]